MSEVVEKTEVAPVVEVSEKRGRRSKAEEFAMYTSACKSLVALKDTLGGYNHVRALLDVLEGV